MPSPHFNGLSSQIHTLFKDALPAIFKPQIGSTQSVEVIFNDRHEEVDKDERPYGAPRPVAWVLSGAIDPKFNDIIAVGGDDYLIKEMKNIGLELIELVLVKV